MTNKEKEKLFFNTIKQQSKKYSWKFKSYFTFKVIDDLYFVANFYVIPGKNNIYGWLAFKPFALDDLFWEIIDAAENSRLPLSFRSEAAFQVTAEPIFEFNITVSDEAKPENEIDQLLADIENEVINSKTKYPSVQAFLSRQFESEGFQGVRMITSLLYLENYGEAIKKIIEFRDKGIDSEYGFGDKDFYDLAEKYCHSKTSKSFFGRYFKR